MSQKKYMTGLITSKKKQRKSENQNCKWPQLFALYDDILAADGWFAGIPIYTRNTEDNSDGMSRRQCTDRYKIQPIFQVRNILGVDNLRGRTVEMVMGISFDEINEQNIHQTNGRSTHIHWLKIKLLKSVCGWRGKGFLNHQGLHVLSARITTTMSGIELKQNTQRSGKKYILMSS